MNVNVDFIGKGTSQGDVAAQFMANGRMEPGVMRPYIGRDGKTYITVFKGGDPNKLANYQAMPALNANAGTLRQYEWKQLDEAIVPIAESRLNGINDLVSRGLVYNLGNAMGTTVLESHTVSDAMEADLTMDAITKSKGDRPVFGTIYLPVPIIHVDYQINARVLAASRSLGNPLDTTSAERAARKVAEKLENMLFTDTSYSYGGGTIYSYLNMPGINTSSVTSWIASAKTGAQIVKDVADMKALNMADGFYGPYVLYVGTAIDTVLDLDMSSSYPGVSIRDRIMKIASISDVKTVDTLPAKTILLVQMTSDVVRLVRGMGIQNVQWSTEGNMVTNYKVMTIQVPQIRADYNGKVGICKGSWS